MLWSLLVVVLAQPMPFDEQMAQAQCNMELGQVDDWTRVANGRPPPPGSPLESSIEKAKAALAECRARAQAQLQQNRSAQADLIAQDRAKTAAVAEQKKRIEEDAQRPDVRAAAWSALLCVATDYRAAAKREVATIQRYSRDGAGLVDMSVLYAWQQTMRAADREIAAARAGLRGLKPLPCRSARISALYGCVAEELQRTMPAEVDFTDGGPETCDQEEARSSLRLLDFE